MDFVSIFSDSTLYEYGKQWKLDIDKLSTSGLNDLLESRMTVDIEYFKDGISLGRFKCLVASSQEVRNEIAFFNGITDYDKFILDDGRAGGDVSEGVLLKTRFRVNPENPSSEIKEYYLPISCIKKQILDKFPFRKNPFRVTDLKGHTEF